MSLLNLFGGGDKKTTTTVTPTQTQDLRTAVGGSVGTLISPGVSYATPGAGAINAAAGATVSQSITSAGMLAEDVATLMQMLSEDRQGERAAMASLGTNLASGLRSQAEQTGDILAATKAPDSTTMTQLLPLLFLLALLWFLTR